LGPLALVELIVGAVALIGIAASVVRFLPRDDAGRIVLPRVVDDSIGMWLVRQVTGRRRETVADATTASPTGGREAVPAAAATREPVMSVGSVGPTDPRPASGPVTLRPTRQVVSAARLAALPVSPTPVAELARRMAKRAQLAEIGRAHV